MGEQEGSSLKPVRGKLGNSFRTSRSSRDLPPRTEGIGPLCTSMRPRKVTLQKSVSLPALEPEIRAKWNERWHIYDTRENKCTQLIHLMAYVQTQEQEHIAKRVKKAIADVPTHQWL